MRVIYPAEINNEIEILAQYVEYREDEGVVIKENAPNEIKERFIALREKMMEFDKRNCC